MAAPDACMAAGAAAARLLSDAGGGDAAPRARGEALVAAAEACLAAGDLAAARACLRRHQAERGRGAPADQFAVRALFAAGQLVAAEAAPLKVPPVRRPELHSFFTASRVLPGPRHMPRVRARAQAE